MYLKKYCQLTAAVILFAVSPVFASPTACPQFFLDGEAPNFINQKLAPKTRELCNQEFAVKHSGITRTPIYAAEVLTREGVRQGQGLPRSNDFRPDNRLPVSERSELSDFQRSGMDRGHVYPAGDAATAAGKDESFLLSNMVPQDSNCNRGIWNDIEGAVRKEVKRRGKLYVVTGPIFQGGQLRMLKGRVIVPSGLFKAIYDPARREAAAYVVNNEPGDAYKVVSLAELEHFTGVNLFPTLPDQVKNQVMQLPVPTGKRRGK
ncbi:DNA/RNA non-specific endonuclease [Geomonas subterranea]|uniref:DNA/RNA non-specific endonuclease n=1 Tax=Geomonas subterranea TaxID=2847989 RepID=UPI001CD36A19|nr:DNA/RNA non-specific endonuclease [Geomonas fuzhouensis]